MEHYPLNLVGNPFYVRVRIRVDVPRDDIRQDCVTVRRWPSHPPQ